MEQSRPLTQFSLPSPFAQASRENARLCAAEQLTQQLHSIATTADLAVIIDVDALSRSPHARGDRLTRLALDALSHVGVQVVVVANDDLDRAVALQRGIPRASCFATTRAAARLRAQSPGVRMIAISNDVELLATLGPEDRGFTVACTTDTSHGVMAGEVSMRAVLWWLVSLRGTARTSPADDDSAIV